MYKRQVVICGGGQVGVETALELLERGHKVSIVEMLPDLILKEELMTRIVMMKKLADAEVPVYCQHKVSRFTDGAVEIEDMQTGEKKLLACGDAVIALSLIHIFPEHTFIISRHSADNIMPSFPARSRRMSLSAPPARFASRNARYRLSRSQRQLDGIAAALPKRASTSL